MIETERLVLRDFKNEDQAALLSFSNDTEVVKYLQRTTKRSAWEVWFGIRLARSRMWQYPRRFHQLAIEEASTGRLVGECCVFPYWSPNYQLSDDEITIGFVFDPAYWGRGYATETARALVAYGFKKLRVSKVYGGCHPDNAASRRVLEKAGLKYHGVDAQFPGSPHGVESLVFQLTREEWDARGSASAPPLDETESPQESSEGVYEA